MTTVGSDDVDAVETLYGAELMLGGLNVSVYVTLGTRSTHFVVGNKRLVGVGVPVDVNNGSVNVINCPEPTAGVDPE